MSAWNIFWWGVFIGVCLTWGVSEWAESFTRRGRHHRDSPASRSEHGTPGAGRVRLPSRARS